MPGLSSYSKVHLRAAAFLGAMKFALFHKASNGIMHD
jgi:hypothetical protein